MIKYFCDNCGKKINEHPADMPDIDQEHLCKECKDRQVTNTDDSSYTLN